MHEEENNVLTNENETVDNGSVDETVDTGANQAETEETEKTTFTQKEVDERIQSETDKVRTKYSKKVKALKETIESLEKEIENAKPVEKSEQEKDYEQRLQALERREKAAALNEALDAKGIDRSISKYLSMDVNVDELATVLDTIVASQNKKNSFVPSGHKSGATMTPDEFKKLNMEQKEKIYFENPELYRTLAHS